jgi:hypothetical protein
MKNPTIKTVSVTRRADRLENKTSERAAVRRHQAALRELDALERAAMMTAPVIKAMADQAGPIPGAGPRTATHPMATPMAPEPRPPMARRNNFIDHKTVRTAQKLTVALVLITAFIFGVAVGRAL